MPENPKVFLMGEAALSRGQIKNALAGKDLLVIEEFGSFDELNSTLVTESLDNLALIVLEISLTDKKDLEKIKILKSSNRLKKVPLLLISPLLNRKNVLLAIRAGANELLLKPYKTEDLLEKIDKLLPDISLGHVQAPRREKSVGDYRRELRQELNRARRGAYSFSVLLARVVKEGTYTPEERKKFLQLNSGFLSTLSKKYRDVLRETDTILDLGLWDCLLMLPFAHKEGVSVVKDKMETTFEDLKKTRGKNDLMGLATKVLTFPEDENEAEKFLDRLESEYKKM